MPLDLQNGVTLIFAEALAIADANQRRKFLETSCDEEIRKEVSSLLLAYEKSDPFMEHPFVEGERREVVALALPRKLGNYTLHEEVGRGGMGLVYRATEHQLNRTVALKVIRDVEIATRNEIIRFYAEARAAAALTHPGIVPVYDAGSADGQHYFAMGFVDGIHLGQALKEGFLSDDDKQGIIEKITTAVAYAHEQGVVHRDLKPENILLSRRGKNDELQPLITDFGLAKRMDQNVNLTLTGQIMGTPGYMAPEQIAGRVEQMNEATDIYAIGALLYHLMSGHPPYQGNSVLETLLQASEATPPRLKSRAPKITDDLSTICHKCLEKVPEKRYHSAKDLLSDLQNSRKNLPLIAKNEGILTRFVKLTKRHPTASVTCLLIATLIAISIIWPARVAITSRRHAKELATQNEALMMTSKKKDEALKESQNERAKSELNRGVFLIKEHKNEEGLKSFLSAAQQAVAAGNKELETLARFQIGTNLQYSWALKKIIELGTRITDFRLSRDGEIIVAVSDRGELLIFDNKNHKLRQRLEHNHPLSDPAISGDGNFLAAVTVDGAIEIWKKRGEKFASHGRVNLKSEALKSISFDHSETLLIGSSSEKIIRRWKLTDLSPIGPDWETQDEIANIDVATDEPLVVAFTKSGNLHAWDLASGEKKFGPVATESPITRGILSPKGNGTCVIHQDAFLGRAYDLWDQTPASHHFTRYGRLEHDGPLIWGLIRDDNRTVLSSSSDRTLRYSSGTTLRVYPLNFGKPIQRFFLGSDEQSLFTMHHEDGEIASWNPPKTWDLQHLYLFDKETKKFTISSEGDAFFEFEQQKLLRRSITSANPKKQRDLFLAADLQLPFPSSFLVENPERKSLLIIAHEETGKILELDEVTLEIKRTSLNKVPLPIDSAVSHDGRYFALLGSGENQILSVLDLETGVTEVIPLDKGNFRTVEFSSQFQNSVIMSANSNTLTWFNWEERTSIKTHHFGEQNLTAVAVCPERGLVAVGSSDRTAAVFREDNWSPVSPVVAHSGEVKILKFIRQGRFVVSSDLSRKALVWEIRSGSLIGPSLDLENQIITIFVNEPTKMIHAVDTARQVRSWPMPKMIEGSLEEIEEELEQKVFTQL